MSFFLIEFKQILENEDPRQEEVNQIFEWLKYEGESALSFAHINAIDDCRRHAELKFSKSNISKKYLWKKSKQALRKLAHRFDELRTTKKISKGRLSIIQGQKEEEKALPSS